MGRDYEPYSAARFRDDPGGRGLMCNDCKHYFRNGACEAFPGGIPRDILKREEHNTPYHGDNGIRFELKTTD